MAFNACLCPGLKAKMKHPQIIDKITDGRFRLLPRRLLKIVVLCICVLCICMMLPACTQKVPEPSGSGEAIFVDDLDRRVAIAGPVKRIISLAPNLTEILFALGLEEEIVGVTSYCDYPAAAMKKERVGDTLRPNPERIIGLRPDLVLVTTSSQLEGLTRELERLSIPVYVTNPRTVRQVIATIRKLGSITGRPGQANELATEMERRVGRIEQRVSGLPGIRALYVLQMEPLISVGKGSYIDDLLKLAGGASISSEETQEYPRFAREAAIARGPEVILYPAYHGNGAIDEGELRRVFANTPAVRFGRLARVNPDWIDRPGPRIVDGLEQVAQALHPESP